MSIISTASVEYAYKNRYRTVFAVSGITYNFEPGRLYAIVGASGCGKTTFLSLLAGLDLPTEGEVSFKKNSIKNLDRDNLRRDHVAVIYQAYNLFPLLTAVENVMYPLKMHKISGSHAKSIAREKLNAVGLTSEYYDSYPYMLSGGEQQRVAIARALASGGEIILADEPTGNLDVENGRNIISILKKLAHENNYCVIVVTHDNSIADQADEVLHMQDGKLIDQVPGSNPAE